MSSDAQALTGAGLVITEHPLTPAMRGAITRSTRRTTRILLGCGVAYLVIFTIILSVADPMHLEGFLLGVGGGLVFCLLLVGIALYSARNLQGRDLRIGTYASATGPLVRRGRRPSARDSHAAIFVYSDRLLFIDNEPIFMEPQGGKALDELSEVTVDYLPKGKMVVEARDMSGNVVYRAPGYQPTNESA